MTTKTEKNTLKIIWTFLGLTALISLPFYALMIAYAPVTNFREGIVYVPALAALLTYKFLGLNIGDIGWKWGKTKDNLFGYLIPLAYATTAYVFIWVMGYGDFPDPAQVERYRDTFGFPGLPDEGVLFMLILFASTTYMTWNTLLGLGEEIGWRGLLAPQLRKMMSFTGVALVSGLIWALWRLPLFIWGGVGEGGDLVQEIIAITVLSLALSFPLTWLRYKTDGIWAPALLHGSHLLFIGYLFPKLTLAGENTPFYAGETGIVLPAVVGLVGLYFWHRGRKEFG